MWLEKSGAINSNDLTKFKELKECRNTLAHRLFEKITTNDLPDLPALFESMFKLLWEIEVWWIVEIEIPTDPDLCDKEINENEIMPDPLLTIDIALGEGEESSYYLNEFKKQTANKACEGISRSFPKSLHLTLAKIIRNLQTYLLGIIYIHHAVRI